jgi:hypothetical protein
MALAAGLMVLSANVGLTVTRNDKLGRVFASRDSFRQFSNGRTRRAKCVSGTARRRGTARRG